MAKKGREFDHSKYERWIDPSAVIPYERNAKKHDDKQVREIANSIRRFGWQQDVVITTDNVLVIGHGRRLAALLLGCEMPYHTVDKKADDLTDKDIRELRIADNQTNAETGFDFAMMAQEIEDLDFEGFEFGFSTETGGTDDFLETFFTPTEQSQDSRPNSEGHTNEQERYRIQCPHCGEWFEP